MLDRRQFFGVRLDIGLVDHALAVACAFGLGQICMIAECGMTNTDTLAKSSRPCFTGPAPKPLPWESRKYEVSKLP